MKSSTRDTDATAQAGAPAQHQDTAGELESKAEAPQEMKKHSLQMSAPLQAQAGQREIEHHKKKKRRHTARSLPAA